MSGVSPTARGRRPGGPDTRGEILGAARRAFAESGFGGTTIRAVAAEAGVDPALVHHYFGTKDELFIAALEIRIDPRQVMPMIFAEGTDGAAVRLLTMLLRAWDDPETRLPMEAMARAGLGGDPAHSLFREALSRLVFTPLREVLPGPDGERRAQLVATQVLGLITGRYLLRLEPLASMPHAEVVAWVAPTIQRYLDGDRAVPPRP